MTRLLCLFALVCSITSVAWAQEDVTAAANAAIARHELVEAIRLLTPVAESGDADAQTLLGSIYLRGSLDVPRNDETAAYWIKRAANQGSPKAQLNLGGMYLKGSGVPRSNMQAHVWLSLGLTHIALPQAAPGDRGGAAMLLAIDSARYTRDQIASYMTDEELAESDRLQSAWRARPER